MRQFLLVCACVVAVAIGIAQGRQVRLAPLMKNEKAIEKEFIVMLKEPDVHPASDEGDFADYVEGTFLHCAFIFLTFIVTKLYAQRFHQNYIRESNPNYCSQYAIESIKADCM
jgi:hypothetical protein